MRKGFLYALSFSMILASQSLTALAEDQPPTGTETPASSSDTREDASEPSSEVTNEAGESGENPTIEAETKDGASDKEADEETEKEENVPEETSVDETPAVPAPVAETESAPMAKAMAPMNAPVSQSMFMIGDTGYATLGKALAAAQQMEGDVIISLTEDFETNEWSSISHKKDNGKIIINLGGHTLKGRFRITISSPIQLVIEDGLLWGTHPFGSFDNKSFDVTSSSASIVFQNLELDSVWADYTSNENYPENSYVFQILNCRNNNLEGAYRGEYPMMQSMKFGSSTADCRVLIQDSRLFNLESAEMWWPWTGPSQHTHVTLNNSIATGQGAMGGLGPSEDASPLITNSTGGMLDGYNWISFSSENSGLHYFDALHWAQWDLPFSPSDDFPEKESVWTTEEAANSDPSSGNYMQATMLVPANQVKIGVIFEDGHEKDYPNLGISWKIATDPVMAATGFRQYNYLNDDTYRDYSMPTYFEETKKLVGSELYDSYDSYVPQYFFNAQGDAMTVPAGDTVVTWEYTNHANTNAAANPTASNAATVNEGNASSSATDTPAFQEVYDLEWNNTNHSLVTPDRGTQFYDYRLKAVRKKYEVVFDANEGSDAPKDETLSYYVDSIASPDASGMKRDGYTFTGWYLDAATTKKFDAFSKVLDRASVETLTKDGALKDGSNTITLYAGWKKNEEKPAQPSQTAKASSATAVSFPRTSNPVSSTGKLFIPRTGVGAEPKSAE